MGNQDSMSHLLSRERQFAKVGPSWLASPPGRRPVVERHLIKRPQGVEGPP